MNLVFNELSDGIRVIGLGGSLDLAGTASVETRFYAHCNAEVPRIVVDLSATTFVGSLGIRMLLQAIKSAKARGGRLIMIHPAAAVASTLELAGLGSFLLKGGADEAVALLAAGK
jgi:anti-sigma B factor antagonist